MYNMREYIGTEREYASWKTGASACHLGRRPEYPTPFIIIIFSFVRKAYRGVYV